MDNDIYENKFAYYSRIIMMIILSFEFILNIIFLAIITDVNSQVSMLDHFYEEGVTKFHKECISATFALFFISFFVFMLELVAYCGCCMKTDCAELCNIIFNKLNHLIILATFLICQFIYFTQCMIIPVFFHRVKHLVYEEFYFEEKIKIIINKYSSMTAICYVFLVLIIFLDFIVLNLYKGLCCQMEIICQNTQNCTENFGRWFIDKIFCSCCSDDKDKTIQGLEARRNEKDVEIYELTGDIRNLMAENMELNIKDYK